MDFMRFTNPLETWVIEGPQERVAMEGQWEGGESGDSLMLSGATFMSKSNVGTLMRSDTEDSGVEICSEASLPSSPPSVSTSNTDIDPTVSDEDGFPSTSSPCSPVLSLPSSCSSSSLSLCPRAQRHRELAAVMHLKLEQALRRADSGDRDAVPRQRCHTASLPSPHTVTHIQRASHRSGSAGLRRTVSQSVVEEQASTALLQHRGGLCPHHKTLPAQTDTEIREKDVCEEEYERLTPGLGYLEQVCRMLEEIASLQLRNQGLQVEMDALREQQGSQNSERNQCDFKASEEGGPSANERLEVKDYEDLPCQSSHSNSNVHQHFRHRSTSDTVLMMGHLKKGKEVSGRRSRTIEDLLEHPEDDEKQEKEESGKKEQGSRTKTWKLKIGSLRRETTEKTSQQMNSSVKKASGRWLGQLFRSRKAVPE
ncbi:uncharacterized protein si:dkey-106l3.7 isoform X1 [Oncorhynchus tshawytscha]|uniref:uncharacterized protein si:dkey-106l3.7 isoform X1 n=1 Tax=Oncorhynchus tshawytscha TaxID=74940 RepID=UPI001C3DECBC|nr:uncharacterized protein si:dkey-106l3.7 isoform X1 [Oncorhynchus tshawytscha]XP_042158170.1 uncharacterized protein si:dkey-106l3.7 isoform X1 [Oncorhynchus tshawytscha]